MCGRVKVMVRVSVVVMGTYVVHVYACVSSVCMYARVYVCIGKALTCE